MAGLANKVYIPLMFKDCSYTTGATGKYAFKWYLPKLPARQGPVCYLSLKNAAIEGTVENTRQCLWLRLNNFYSENVLVNEVNAPNVGGTILAMLDFRGNTDHYTFLPESAIKVQLSSNLPNYFEFDMIDSDGTVEILDPADATATINFLLQIEYPEYEEVPKTIVNSYVASEVGMPPFNKLKL